MTEPLEQSGDFSAPAGARNRIESQARLLGAIQRFGQSQDNIDRRQLRPTDTEQLSRLPLDCISQYRSTCLFFWNNQTKTRTCLMIDPIMQHKMRAIDNTARSKCFCVMCSSQ